jgi:glucose/arabinose dehydrogenase
LTELSANLSNKSFLGINGKLFLFHVSFYLDAAMEIYMRIKATLRIFVASSLLLIIFYSYLPTLAKQASIFNPAKIKFQLITTGLTQPVFLTNANDGSGRLFIVERAGRILIVKNGSLLSAPFLDIRSITNSTGGEQGLLALAFHPGYSTNGQFYTVHTNRNGSLVLSGFMRSATNPDQADPNSRTRVLTISHPTYQNHNGGTLAFGPDGYLYWSTGDGGGGGDPSNNAQNRSSLLGKILRLDVDSGSPYAIPPNNPFFNNSNPSIRKEIWAYGLRNPYRFSFDRQTGDMYIGDVGQGASEEVNFQPANDTGGKNYGWRVMEGSLCYNPASGCNKSGKVLPVAEYDHSIGCSITGGYVYRGSQYLPLQEHYFYGDYCTGVLFSLHNDAPNQWTATQVADTPYFISSFGEDENGELYLADYSQGRIYQIQYEQDVLAPGDVTDLTAATGTSNGTVSLRWTAPYDDADDNRSGPVTSYLVKYATSTISNETDWANATIVSTGLPAPVAPGTTQTMIVAGLQSDTVYYFAVRARDEQPNQSINFATASTSTKVPIPMPAGMYDDIDPEWNYSTGWMTGTPGGSHDNTIHRTRTKDATATFIFQAPAFFTLYYRTGPNRGSFEIWVDGELLKTINANSPTIVWQKTYTSPAYVDSDSHTIVVKNISPNGTPTDVDAIQIISAPPPSSAGIYDDADLLWIYSSDWVTTTPSGALDGTIHRTSVKGSTATFVFQAPAQFTFYYRKGPNRGSFTIWVDGAKIATINAYSIATKWQRTYLSPVYNDGEAHTVVIKNISPDGTYIDVDAIEIVGP